MKNCRHQPYAARVQYLQVKTQVEEMLAAGYSARHIYDQLYQESKINMGYSAFCDYVRGQGKRLHKSKKFPQRTTSQRLEPAAKPAFVRPSADVKDLI